MQHSSLLSIFNIFNEQARILLSSGYEEEFMYSCSFHMGREKCEQM